MKIKFDPNLAFQKQAIDAITGVFEGQEICRTNFTVAPLQFTSEPALPGMEEKGLGIGNRLKLLDDDILENIRRIQLDTGWPLRKIWIPWILPWRWRPVPERPMCICGRFSNSTDCMALPSLLSWCPPLPSRKGCINHCRSRRTISGSCMKM